jgi:hypothetical protein
MLGRQLLLWAAAMLAIVAGCPEPQPTTEFVPAADEISEPDSPKDPGHAPEYAHVEADPPPKETDDSARRAARHAADAARAAGQAQQNGGRAGSSRDRAGQAAGEAADAAAKGDVGSASSAAGAAAAAANRADQAATRAQQQADQARSSADRAAKAAQDKAGQRSADAAAKSADRAVSAAQAARAAADQAASHAQVARRSVERAAEVKRQNETEIARAPGPGEGSPLPSGSPPASRPPAVDPMPPTEGPLEPEGPPTPPPAENGPEPQEPSAEPGGQDDTDDQPGADEPGSDEPEGLGPGTGPIDVDALPDVPEVPPVGRPKGVVDPVKQPKPKRFVAKGRWRQISKGSAADFLPGGYAASTFEFRADGVLIVTRTFGSDETISTEWRVDYEWNDDRTAITLGRDPKGRPAADSLKGFAIPGQKAQATPATDAFPAQLSVTLTDSGHVIVASKEYAPLDD